MNRSRTAKCSRRLAERNRAKKVTAHSSSSQINKGQINIYGHWVCEMSVLNRGHKDVERP